MIVLGIGIVVTKSRGRGGGLARGCITRHLSSTATPYVYIHHVRGWGWTITFSRCGWTPLTRSTLIGILLRKGQLFDMLQFITNHARQFRRGDRCVAAPRAKREAHDRLPATILHRIRSSHLLSVWRGLCGPSQRQIAANAASHCALLVSRGALKRS